MFLEKRLCNRTGLEKPSILAGPFGTRLKAECNSGYDPSDEALAAYIAQGADGPVGHILTRDRAAGANVFQTPTFRKVDGELYYHSVQTIREVVGRDAKDWLLAVDFGPQEDCYSPHLAPGETDARHFHTRSLAIARPHVIDVNNRINWFETVGAHAESMGIARASLEEPDVPLALNYVIDDEGNLLDGTEIDRIAQEILGIRKDARIGVNCCSTRGAEVADNLLQQRLSRKLDIVYVNATDECGNKLDGCHGVHGIEPQELARRVSSIGVNTSGFCCGGNETYIRELTKLIDA